MKKNLPLVSVVTPSLNQGVFIGETLSSVRGQDYSNMEHIVVDGGSEDGTVDILSTYARTYNLYWLSESDQGQSHALNKGLKRTTGEIVGWLNSDDTYLPGAIHKVVMYFEAHPDVDWVYGDGYVIDMKSRVLRTWHAQPFDLKALLGEGQFICQPATFFRRRALEVVGRLDQTLHLTMDYDLFIRLGRKCKVAYLPELLATRRLTRDAKSLRQAELFCNETLRTLKKLFGETGLSPDLLAVKKRAYALAYYQGGKRFFEQGSFAAARKHLWRAWRLDKRVLCRKTGVIVLLILQSMLGKLLLVPKSYCGELRRTESSDGSLQLSVAWPVDWIADF